MREIMTKEPPTSKGNIIRLEDYGFITKAPNGHYFLRVPLFEQWIEKYGESYPSTT